MAKQIVFIDYENVQPESFEPLNRRNIQILIFFGSHQRKQPIKLADSLQKFGARAKFTLITRSGKNALDFVIAYYLGKYSASNPGASFYIVSKDTGYEPLIEHMRECGRVVRRIKDVNEMPRFKEPSPPKAKKLDSIAKG